MTRGEIHNVDAYMQGKVFNHSEWFGILPRRITPSDIDTVWDASGCLLVAEFTRRRYLQSMPKGQRMMYQNLVRANPVKIMFASCCHHVPVEFVVNTLTDVEKFTVGTINYRGSWQESEFTGDRWKAFVTKFFATPQALIHAMRMNTTEH